MSHELRGFALCYFLLPIPACTSSSSLARVDPEPPGDHCKAGGAVIRTGIDLNRNGQLEEDELRDISYVCNGVGQNRGDDPLIKLQPEPPGDRCADGGTLLLSGPDLDADGALEDNEVSSTTFVCNGGNGTLVRVTTEPPGTHCLRGGTAIATGTDRNHDGILEDAEVLTSAFVCAPSSTIVVGDVHLKGPADLAALANVPRIEGSLFVEDPNLKVLYLPDLISLAGDLSVTDTTDSLTAIRLPALLNATGELSLGGVRVTELQLTSLRRTGALDIGGPITTFDFSALETVDGTLSMGGLPAIPSMPKLQIVGGDFILSNIKAATVTLPPLTIVGGNLRIESSKMTSVALSSSLHVFGNLYVNDNEALTDLHLGAYVEGDFLVDKNTALRELSTPAAARTFSVKNSQVQIITLGLAGDSLPILEVYNNPSLITILDQRYLRNVGQLMINENHSLKTLWLPSLEHVSVLSILNNANLPQCQVDALLANVSNGTPFPFTPGQTEGNDTTATCN